MEIQSMSDKRTILFGEKAAGVYLLTDIYDPDKHGLDIEASGKYVPAVGSLVVDNTKGLHNQQYTVVSVDPVTYKVSMVPSAFVQGSDVQPDRVLSYGNDIFMLYFTSATIKTPENNIYNITRLIVDNKLSLYGNHAATYQLMKLDSEGREEIISRWYDASGHQAGTAIPMLSTGVEGIRKCDGCYTEATLEEGDMVYLKVFSAAGLLIAQITLIAKRAHFLNEYASAANPIVGFDISANQMFPDGVIYLYQGQNTEDLALFTDLIYADGSRRKVGIDNRRGFAYGLEEVCTNIPDVEYTVLVKYYLSESDVISDNTYVYQLTDDVTFITGTTYYTRVADGLKWVYQEALVIPGETIPLNTYYIRRTVNLSSGIDNNIKFIYKYATIRIVEGTQDLIAKISPIPVWTGTKWLLRFFKYRTTRQTSPTGEDVVLILNNSFDGAAFGQVQEVTIEADETSNGTSRKVTRTFAIEVNDKNSQGTINDGINWLIADHTGVDHVYGDDTPPHIRPRIFFDGANYRVPNHIFTASPTLTALEVFLENFYTLATPPMLVDEGVAPLPTHFLIKDPYGSVLMTRRMPITSFTENLDLITGSGPLNKYVGTTLVMEFSRDLPDASTEILYGVPVDVVS